MTSPDPMSGALWCEEHRRWECVKNSKRTTVRCHNIAIGGRDACRNHVGESLEVAKAKGEALTAWRALPGGGADQLVDPGQAVLGMLQMSWLRVSMYSQLLEAQVGTDGGPAVEPGARGRGVEGQQTAAGTGGLIGHTFAADKQAGIFASGEAMRGLVLLEAQERDRVVRFAKVAHDMGIAEAQIRLAEQQGQLLATGVVWFLRRRGLEDDPVARADLVLMLRAMDSGDLSALEAPVVEGQVAP